MSDLVGFTPVSGVAAVSLNVTVTGTDGAGFAVVYPCGLRPAVSSVNFSAGGATVANSVTTPVSATGTVCFFTTTGADVLADLNGWFGP